ncbi:unnamed protein product [Alopecurus aequalis]
MAALHTCFFSPVFSAASSSTRPLVPTGPSIVSAVGCRERRLPVMKTTTGPRPRLAVVRAQNRDARSQANQPPAAGDHFHQEMERITQHYNDIISTDGGFLYAEATAMSARVCLSANEALAMACLILDSARLNLGEPGEISAETTHGTVRLYAAVFSAAAEDSYRRKVNKKTVVSFLGALRGLAAVSHIMIEGALEALCHKCPREAVSEYAFNSDVEDMYREFEQGMREVEDEIRNTSAVATCRLAVPVILAGTKIAGSFVGLMVDRRRRALEKARSKSPVL